MIKERSVYCLTKIVLEAQSAHGIHSGLGDTTHDVLLVRDANGLPSLPGSSIAGVLRHRYREQFGHEAEEALFGSLDHPSWISIQWGVVHNSKNIACEGLIAEEEIHQDPILMKLKQDKPIVRQRVRLNSFGTAVYHAKFDTTLMPAGVRYTTFISYWCDGSENSKQLWQQLHSIFAQPIYLGHGIRSGSGVFKVIKHLSATWDLTSLEGKNAFLSRPRSRNEDKGLSPAQIYENSKMLSVNLPLQSEGGFRIGGGEISMLAKKKQANKKDIKIPDLLPQHEYKINWNGDFASISNVMHLLPGTAIKGAIRHRVAYHYRRLTGEFVSVNNNISRDILAKGAEESIAVKQLFGFSSSEESHAVSSTSLLVCEKEAELKMEAGMLIFHDIYLKDATAISLMHNKIDRYTGGVIGKALFEEEILWCSPIEIKIDVLGNYAQIEPNIRRALQATLDDLASGWLPLGAGGSRGLGTFTLIKGQSITWSDNGVWAFQQEMANE